MVRSLIDLAGMALLLTALWMVHPALCLGVAGVSVLFFNRERGS